MTTRIKALTMTGAAALSLATALACGVAGTGCSGSNSSIDGGSGNDAASGGSGNRNGSGAMSGDSGMGSGATSGGSGAMSGTSSGMGSSGMTALPPCPTPTFAPASGAIAAGSNVAISAAGLPAGGQILFTTDGTTPSRASPIYNAGAVGVQVTVGETIAAIATTMGATCTDSVVAMAKYTIAPAMDGGTAPSTPTFSPGGTATTQSNDFLVSLTSTGSTICYALGATAPTCVSNATAATCGAGSSTFTAPISISATTTAASAMPGQVEIQAIACAPGQANSAVARALYTLQVATPAMTPAPGAQVWSPTLMGALTTATMGATINYTSNGTAPSCTTPVAGQQTFAAPFALQAGSYQAIACKTGYLASALAGPFAFTVALTPPTVTPPAGTFASSPTFTVSNAANPTTSWVCYSSSTTAPACGAAGVCSAGTLLPPSGTFTGATNGGSVQVIACAPANLTSSGVNSQGPYKLQLAAPVILPDATTAPAASYTLPAADGTHLAHLNISQAAVATTADQAGGYMCWLRDPGVGIAPSCGGAATPCLNGSTLATGNGPTDIEPMGPFGAGDSVAVVTCPGTTAATGMGFAPSAVSTTVFVGQGQAMPPTISATDTSATQPVPDTMSPWFGQVNAVLTNPNAASMTVCYTTDGTPPVCTAGSTAAGCATVDGTSSQNLNFKIIGGGIGYVNPPTVLLTPNNCLGNPVATLTAGAVTSIAAMGCSGYATPPSVDLHTGSGAAAAGTATETLTFTVTNGGAGYVTAAPKVILTPADGIGSCVTVTATRTADAVTAIAATGCTFDENPTVSFDNTGTGGSGAVATVRVTQTVTFPAAQITGGKYYTGNPAITALTPVNGMGGTCTTVTAVQTGGVVTAVTASGCSGFSDFGTNDVIATFASQGPMDNTANAAAAIAVPGNALSVPAIQNNPTTLKTVACNAGLATSPIVSSTYQTMLSDPTIVATDTLTGAAVPAVAGVITLTAGDTLTVSTTSNFTDTQLVYTTDGTTIPNCTGTGTAFAGTSTTIPVPDPSLGTITVRVIACGANQQASTMQHRTFPIAVAAPVITSAVGTLALGSPGTDSAATVHIQAQNVVTATIKSPTAGSYICYSTNGTTVPTCGGGAAAACGANQTLVNGVAAMVTINKSETIQAIACKGANSSTVTGPVVYALAITPVAVIGTPTATCPSVVTIGFDATAMTNTSLGGPTTGAQVCYSTAPGLTACGPAAGVTCFNPTVAAPTATVSLSASGNLYTVACKANFMTVARTLAIVVAPYSPPAITVDGTLNIAEWSTALGDQFPSSTAAANGGVTFGKATATGDTIFLSESGFTAAAGTDVIFYITDNATATGATTTTARRLGANALPFKAKYAIDINTHGATGCTVGTCTVTVYQNTGGATAATWAAVAPAPAVTAAVAAHAVEASILISALPGAEAAGDVFEFGGEVYNGVALSGGWSKTVGGAETYVSNYSSSLCSPPLLSLH